MNTDKLLKLAAHLESDERGHEEFNFILVTKGNPKRRRCGSTGCALGEIPFAFPDEVEFSEWSFAHEGHKKMRMKELAPGGIVLSFSEVPKILFQIDESMSRHLFYPNSQLPDLYGGVHLSEYATPQEVAQNIRDFVSKFETNEQRETT